MVERFRFKGYRDVSVTLDGRVDDREMGLTDRGRYRRMPRDWGGLL
jgi:hypothetical protein